MDNLDQLTEEVDFTHSNYTAIISDLHLCEAEPVNQKYPLWKKYKTREFFFDDQLNEFMEFIDQAAEGEKVELILNGDIFDFDSAIQIPDKPTYQVSWLERKRGLEPEKEKSRDKMRKILNDHQVWCEGLKSFIEKGHKVIFIIGNHDLELHWKEVQKDILDHLNLEPEDRRRVRFVEWFYISNKDTLVEHGNQYDPYCRCDDPINPFVIDYNHVQVRLPFGDWASRYLTNGMGFFNPHAEGNYVMTVGEYAKVFFKYMIRAQPLILWTWFWSSVMILWRSVYSNMQRPLNNPLTVEQRIEHIARRSNATPRMVREMRELFVIPASSSPLRLMKELWLDRAFLLLLGLFLLYFLFLNIDQLYNISFYWIFIPIFVLLPPFVIYSRSVDSYVSLYKEPQERILTTTSLITKVYRVIYGHTHEVRHEVIGGVEHLNSGTWSPAFEDIECTRSEDTKTFIWISPGRKQRKAQVLQVKEGGVAEFLKPLT